MGQFDKPDSDEQAKILPFPLERVAFRAKNTPTEQLSAEMDAKILSLTKAREQAREIREHLKTPEKEPSNFNYGLDEKIFRLELIDGMRAAGITPEKASEIFDTAAIVVRSLELYINRSEKPGSAPQNTEEKLAQFQSEWDATLLAFQEQYPQARKTWYSPDKIEPIPPIAPMQKRALGTQFFNWLNKKTFIRAANAFTRFLDNRKSPKN